MTEGQRGHTILVLLEGIQCCMEFVQILDHIILESVIEMLETLSKDSDGTVKTICCTGNSLRVVYDKGQFVREMEPANASHDESKAAGNVWREQIVSVIVPKLFMHPILQQPLMWNVIMGLCHHEHHCVEAITSRTG